MVTLVTVWAHCRIQECTRQLGQEHVKVQLWDVAGGSQFQNYWELLSKVRTTPAHEYRTM
jgi:hypothetical protein